MVPALVFILGLLALVVFFGYRSCDPMAKYEPPPSPAPVNRLPEFPWPPRSSAYTKIPSSYLVKPQGETYLKDVAFKLELAFRSGGYGQTGYYSVPGGFALVSQLEQFKPNGLPAADPYRWSLNIETHRPFSVEYLSDLIKGKVGHYRVIVFAISNDFFAQATGKRVDIDQANRIAIEGANRLPSEVGDLLYTNDHTCTALVYEFEKTSPYKAAEFKETSTLIAEMHLQKILPFFQR